MICTNCGADVLKLSESFDGQRVCCMHCIFHPLGCRCGHGEFGVEEKWFDAAPVDPDYAIMLENDSFGG